MSAASTARPAERLALIVATLCLVTALPIYRLDGLFATVFTVAGLVLVLVAFPVARKRRVADATAAGWAGAYCVALAFAGLILLNASPAIVLLSLQEQGLRTNSQSTWLIALACLGACLPFVVALLAIVEPPTEWRFRLMRTLGLLQVGIACLISVAPWTRWLTLLYLVSLILALSPHRPDPGARLILGEPSPDPPRSRSFWRLLALAAAFAAALLTPPDALRWLSGKGFGGFSRYYGMDLHQSGPIRLSRKVAVRVRATHLDGSPKDDLPGDLRFRHQVLELYASGAWVFACSSEDAHREAGDAVADLGPDAFLLDYHCRKGAMGPVAAEPVRLAAGEPRSPISRAGAAAVPLFLEANGSLRANPFTAAHVPPYRQVVPGSADRKTPAEALTDSDHQRLRLPPPAVFVDFAEALVVRLAQEGGHGLDESDLATLFGATLEGQEVIPRNAERVAEALASHFAESGEYSYTLNRPRRDLTIDPTLDFLVNVKAGHCERFASGLALVLRAWQIPCRVVIGYRGVERVGAGSYVVRQSRAHAWVEALVPRAGEPGRLDWLTLDPTPPAPAGLPESSSWWDDFLGEWDDWWGDSRDWLWQDVWPALSPWLLAPAAALVLLPLAVRAFLRRRRTRPLPPAYARLLALLRRCGLPPSATQTPQEHAEQAAAALGSDAPMLVVAAYYRERYGGAPPTPEEARRLGEALDGLERSLPRRWLWWPWR